MVVNLAGGREYYRTWEWHFQSRNCTSAYDAPPVVVRRDTQGFSPQAINTDALRKLIPTYTPHSIPFSLKSHQI